MRISSAVVGIFGFIVLIILTGLCSVVSYGFTRQAVVDMWDSGLRIDSPVEMVAAVINPGEFEIAASATPPERITFPSPTPEMVASEMPVETVSGSPVVATSIPDVAATTETETTPAATPTLGSLTAADAPTQAALDGVGQWSDPRQIRILLMGIDQRTDVQEDERFFRTDTMMLVNIDPVRKTAGVLSIPRDLWVDIPNVGSGRINQAHREGDVIQYPGGGGPALAMETVANNFGVRVDRFLVVNFDLFEKVVDIIAPEGVEVCPAERIYDPAYPDIASYGTIEITFEPGCQRLKGIILLRYARTRKTEGGDFDRAKRQQEVLKSTLNEVLSAGGIANFVSQIPALWSELSDSYNTNLSLTDVINLGYLMMEIPVDEIRFATVDNNYVTFGKSPTGDDVLVPSWGAISTLVENTLYPNTATDTTVLATDYQQENALIYVYNGTDIGGLANNTREWLLGRGVRVTDVGNAPNHNNQPGEIRIYAANIQQYMQTAGYLAALLDIGVEKIKPGLDGLIAEGVMVVAGPDMPEKISR